MYIGEPITREIIIVPLHEISEADMKEIKYFYQETEVDVVDIYYNMDLEISHELRRIVNQIRDAGIAHRIQFNEGNG